MLPPSDPPPSEPTGGHTLTGAAGTQWRTGGPALFIDPEWAAAHLPLVAGYETLEFIGHGGMGAVYKAVQLDLKRTVALKMILSGRRATPEEEIRFRIEAEAIARLSHPNIVQIYHVGDYGGLPYFSMEFLEGGNLSGRINGRPTPPFDAARLVETLARAVHFAHVHGVVHCDLKPANVLLTRGGAPKISDFGLARRLEDEDSPFSHHAPLGTASYMAPEQVWGHSAVREVGPLADVYGLGGILYELLTGRPPFRGKDVQETLSQVWTSPPVPIHFLTPGVPRDLGAICMKCLEKSPQDRYDGAEAVAEDLRRFLAGETTEVRPGGRLERIWRWCLRAPLAASLVASLAILLVAAFAAVTGALVSALHQKEIAEIRSKEARDAQVRASAEHEQSLRLQTRLLQAERRRAEILEHELAILYAHRIALAQRELLDNHAGRALDLLDQCQPELRGWEWRYLTGLCDEPIVQSIFQRGEVYAVAADPDRRRLAAAGQTGIVLVIELPGEGAVEPAPPVRHELVGHTQAVTSLAFSPDGRHLASASWDGTLRLWDAEKKESVGQAEWEQVLPYGVGWSGDSAFVACAVSDGTVRVWQREGLVPSLVLRAHEVSARDVAFRRDATALATVGAGPSGGEVKLWSFPDATPLWQRPAHRERATCVAFSPDGSRLASSGMDGLIREWDADSGSETALLRGHRDEVTDVSYHPSGGQLASSSSDQCVKVWDLALGEPLRTFRGHKSPGVAGVAYVSRHQLASGAWDGGVMVWDAVGNSEFSRWSVAGGSPTAVAVIRGAARHPEAGGGSDVHPPRVMIWDPQSSIHAGPIEANATVSDSARFDPTGRRMAVLESVLVVQVHDSQEGAAPWRLEHDSAVLDFEFSSDGRGAWLVDAQARLFPIDVESRRLGSPMACGRPPISAARIDPASEAVAVAGQGGIRIHSMTDGARRKQLRVEAGAVQAIMRTRAPASWLLLCRDLTRPQNDRILAWDDGQPTARQVVATQGDFVLHWSAHPEEARLLTVTGPFVDDPLARQVRIWDLRTGEELISLSGPAERIDSALFSPDGLEAHVMGRGLDGQLEVRTFLPRATRGGG